jgi:PAS domain S-box-containing protein
MREKQWFWATLALSSLTIVSVVFAAWEVVDNRFFRNANYITLHYLYITRGMATSLLLAFWAAWFVLKQRRQSEEDLRRSRERYRGLLEAVPGAVILYDSALRILEWNASAERMYGYTRSEVMGLDLPLVPEEKTAELRDFMRSVESGVAVLDVETTRRPKSGDPFEVQLSLLPFRESTGPSCFLEVTSDIRERVRWRRHMLEIEKLTSMGKMAAGTAHHLNSPLAALLMRVQMMRHRLEDSTVAEDVSRIEDGLQFCRHFVQRLLDFTRSAPVHKEPQDISLLVESVGSFFLPAIRSKGVSLVVDVAGGNGRSVHADRNLMETLLLILLSNALDAVAPGGEIRLLCLAPALDRAGFAVRDNGCGISAAHRERVFEPFFTTKEPGKGTGLGLAIARNVVLEHGGTIEIESEAGMGTTVTVELPVTAVEPMTVRSGW